MNKKELVSALKKETKIKKRDAKIVIENVFDSMADTLVDGERVELRGLFSFHVKSYKSYMGRNPLSGEKVMTKPKKLPFFKCGKELKKRVDS